MGRLKVTKTTSTGKNIRFKDVKTGRYMDIRTAVKAVKNGTYKGYHTRDTKSGTIIASNPDSSVINNLG